MRLVQQKQENDCGVACVAMLANVSYAEAKEVIFGDEGVGLTKSEDIKEALLHFGLQISPRFVPLRGKSVSAINKPAIIKTNLRINRKEWHWVVWSGRSLLDPKIPPYIRLRPVSYLIAEPPYAETGRKK